MTTSHDNKIINIDEYKPHVAIHCGDTIHILATSTIEDVIKGKIRITDIDDYEEIVKRILDEWLTMVG